MLRFQGRTIAGDLQFTQDGKQFLSAHLESIETMATVDATAFLPPPDATKPAPNPVPISAAVSTGYLIKKVPPEYPQIAKQERISGIVNLQAVIGKDGHITKLEFLDGPLELRQAALTAVKQWVYSPYLMFGEPVEVTTTIHVIFTLGR
jgi:protein TonB